MEVSISKQKKWIFIPILVLPIILAISNNAFDNPQQITEADIAVPNTGRSVVDFEFNWLFELGHFSTAMMPGYDDNHWRQLDLPHDWSIEEPLSADYASGNGYALGGIGWYRKHFQLPENVEGKMVAIEFDGVYCNSQVWINGHYLGIRPNGYIGFQYDLTPHLHFGEKDNVIAVRVDHSRFADSRWYTGSGIYRHVRLIVTDKLKIGHWGTFVTTPKVDADKALVATEIKVENNHNQDKEFELKMNVLSPTGEVLSTLLKKAVLNANGSAVFHQEFEINNPQLWSINTPKLYSVESQIFEQGKLIDKTSTNFGIRTIRFDPDKGFFLNGENIKFKGVCLHHDAGCVGAAVPDKVLERRLRLMKELGANAIRTSHNPPAPELLVMCDTLGLLVKDESFDEFTPPKNKWVKGWNNGIPSRFGYGEFFKDWSVIDMRDLVRRDRNHPCIVMWSIGNEIDYQNDPFSHPSLGENYDPLQPPAENLVLYAKPLVETIKEWDTTRPVTAALANITMSNAVGLPQLFDVVGYNYQEQFYGADHATYPNRFIFGSENGDSYEAWKTVRDNDYIAGQFLWTGIDYLGEARQWPNKANGSGLLDLCGYKKPIAWFRQGLWSENPMVYVCAKDTSTGRRRGYGLESWNWEGNQTLAINCFTNCQEVVIHLNDKEIGTKKYQEAENGVLSWNIPFKPGELKAIGKNKGNIVCEYTLRTAGKAKTIQLQADVDNIKANGKDVCHLFLEIADENGIRMPHAQNEFSVSIEGPGHLLGIENGNRRDVGDCKDNLHNAFQGRAMAIIQSTKKSGKVIIRVESPGLEGAMTSFESH